MDNAEKVKTKGRDSLIVNLTRFAPELGTPICSTLMADKSAFVPLDCSTANEECNMVDDVIFGQVPTQQTTDQQKMSTDQVKK
ncbi:hypothetical protein PENTCL1PPCAC_13324 [Pristionchus entomophagus]|uniref:Uncharacterized protein n=1 Tax=Pristionchus entomophagus TaxID=358040 RepID=A0AAV5TE68_9BILA|nr:hypothetical protein PENTCL1PPCAC_13324 [Pristionchus entomophagus]